MLSLPRLLQGHKRAPSDVSVASSEDDKITLSPSVLESVPEKAELLVPVAVPAGPPVANSVEEPVAPAAREHREEASDTPDEDEELPKAPEPEAQPQAPDKEMQQLEITAEDEKEVDIAELPASSKVAEVPQEGTIAAVEESNAPTDDEEEQYKHLKVTLTLPEQEKVDPREENGEKPTDKDEVKADDDAVPDKERDSDSGSGSAADNSGVDLNLSISSFLSKAKEPGSVSIQVTYAVQTLKYQKL